MFTWSQIKSKIDDIQEREDDAWGLSFENEDEDIGSKHSVKFFPGVFFFIKRTSLRISILSKLKILKEIQKKDQKKINFRDEILRKSKEKQKNVQMWDTE